MVILEAVVRFFTSLIALIIALLPADALTQTVFDQTSGIINLGIASQDFETSNNRYDCEAADDFTIPIGVNWTIDSIEIFGQYSNLSDSMGFRLTIYDDNSGGPGSVVYQREWLSNVDQDGDGNVTFRIQCPLQLMEGKYWLSAQAIKPLSGGGQWYWLRDSVGSGDVFKWKNPAGGFGTSCFSFTPINICATSITEPGTAFILYGCAGGPNLDNLPQDTVVCANDSYVLAPDTNSLGFHTYIWNTGDTSGSIVVDSARDYRVSVTDISTGCYTVRCAQIGVVHIPDPGLFDDTICQFGGTSSGAFFSTLCPNCINIWNGTDTNNVFFSYSEEGSIIKRVLDTIVGCFEEDTAHIELQDVPLVLSPSDTNELCLGDTLELSATLGYASYFWSKFTDPGWLPYSDSSTLTIWSSGEFRVVVTTQFGCQATDTAQVKVNANPFPVIQDAWMGDSIVLFTSEAYTSYLWSNGSTDSAMIPDSNGIYSVIVVDSNGCSSADEILVEKLSAKSILGNRFEVYPNPTAGRIIVRLDDQDSHVLIQLVDAFGDVLFEQANVKHFDALSLPQLPSGPYWIQVISDGQRDVKLLMVSQ